MGDQTNVILLVLLGTLVMFVLILVIVVFSVLYSRRMNEKDHVHRLELKNQELVKLRAVIAAEEAQKEKIAMNIHDEIGPLLSALKLNYSKLERHIDKGEVTKELIQSDKSFMDDIINKVRRVSHDLSPHYLMKFGLIHAIENFMDSYEDIESVVSSDLDENNFQIAKSHWIHVYYMVTELVNNCIKHDSATEFSLSFELIPGNVELIIGHNGKGISTEDFNKFAEQSKGLGLDSLKTRAVILNSTITFYNDDPSDVRIEIIIPYE